MKFIKILVYCMMHRGSQEQEQFNKENKLNSLITMLSSFRLSNKRSLIKISDA